MSPLYSGTTTYPLKVMRGTNWQGKKMVISMFCMMKADDQPIFKSHLESAAYNANYMSPDIRNELIELASKHLLHNIVDRKNKCSYLSIN